MRTGEVRRLQAQRLLAMTDRCIVQRYTPTIDSYHDKVDGWVDDVASIACTFTPTGTSQLHRSDSTIVSTNATVALPAGATLDVRDRIKLTERFGIAITPVVYAVDGELQNYASALLVPLKRVLP